MTSQNLNWFHSLSLPADVQAEVYRAENEVRAMGISEGKSHLSTTSHSIDFCLRVIRDHHSGVLTTTRLASENWKLLFEKALEISAVSSPDEHRTFYQPDKKALNPIPVDDKIFSESNKSIIDKLKQIEQQILKSDSRIKKVLRLQMHETRQHKSIVNSWSLNANSQSTATSYLAEILVEQGNQVEAGWDTCESRFGNKLELSAWADKLAREAVQSLGAKALPSASYAILFHPRVGTALLSLLGQALSAEAVQLGRSFLKGSIGQEVFNSLVTLVDDPLLPAGIATDCIDDEGVPQQKLTVAENGVLNHYFYDVRSASREGVSSNGHGLKGGLAANPTPLATNLYLVPGKNSFEDLLKKAPTVFVVHDVMGLHMADPITGEFSLGASGSFYQHGKFQQAVRGVTIAGTVLEVFKKISAIGSDLHWKGSYGAPYFLVPAMTVAGA